MNLHEAMYELVWGDLDEQERQERDRRVGVGERRTVRRITPPSDRRTVTP